MIYSDLDALWAAQLKAVPGDVLLLASGTYQSKGNAAALAGNAGTRFAEPGIVIAGADPANPPVIVGAEYNDCAGVTLRDLVLLVNPRNDMPFRANNCERMGLERVTIDDARAYLGGALFSGGAGHKVIGCRFRNTNTAVRVVGVTGVLIQGNDFAEVRGDGIQSAGSSGVTIDANRFTNFRVTAGDHPDAIQFLTKNQAGSARDIVITGNVIQRGDGDIIQGIFLGDEDGKTYIGVRITGNAMAGTMYNGIYVYNGQDVTIADNIVQAFADMDSGIKLFRVAGGSLKDNTAQSELVDASNTGVVSTGFQPLKASKPGDGSAVTAWLAAKNPPVVEPPPVVVEPVPNEPDPPSTGDTRDAQIAALTAAGLGVIATLRAEADVAGEVAGTRAAALEQIATLAAAGKKLTSAAKMKPVFDQIIARTGA